MQENIILLVNSRSGKGKAMRLSETVQQDLLQRSVLFTKAVDSWPDDLTGFTAVWLFGGDGTVNYFINRYSSHRIPLAVFKGGTGNDFAWKLYGDISPQEQTALILNSTPKKTDLGICNGRLYADSLGLGFDGEVLRSMDTVRWLGGHLGYLFVVIKKIFSFREYSFQIKTTDRHFGGKYLLMIINNSSRTGGGFMVSPKASLTDGLLDMVLCKRLSLLKRLKYLPIIEKGKHIDLPFIHYSHETHVEISCEKEIFAQIDGELIAADKFKIEILPGSLSVIY